MAITRMAIAREIPPQAAGLHLEMRPTSSRGRSFGKTGTSRRSVARNWASSPFSAQPVAWYYGAFGQFSDRKAPPGRRHARNRVFGRPELNCLRRQDQMFWLRRNRTRTESKATNKRLHPRHPRSADRGRVSHNLPG